MIESDRELSALVQELWDNDVNRLKPGKDYRISLQVTPVTTRWSCLENIKVVKDESWKRFACFPFVLQGKAGNSMGIEDNNDGAGYPLFTFVDENIFKKETFLSKDEYYSCFCTDAVKSSSFEWTQHSVVLTCSSSLWRPLTQLPPVSDVWIEMIPSRIPQHCLPVRGYPPYHLPSE